MRRGKKKKNYYKIYKIQRQKELTKWRKENPELARQQWNERVQEQLAWKKKNMPIVYKAERLLYYSRIRAKEKGFKEPTITRKWIIQNIFKGCSRTGRDFVIDNDRPRHPYGPSIHRLNNSEGYTPENCELVIWSFNSGVSEHAEEDLYKMFKALFAKNF